MAQRPRVVIVGAGFGGLKAAKHLAKAPVDVTVVDRWNHHLFQPLLYQVATAGLSPANIATPIRSILHSRNTEVILDELTSVDWERQKIQLKTGIQLPYDYLIIATGATHSYFGHPEWSRVAPGLKSVDDATCIRRNILIAFERAEEAQNPDEQAQWLTFIVIGAGPTGVEMAGAIAELAQHALKGEFKHIDPEKARIVLVEGGPRVLAAYPESLSAHAKRDLEKLGVEVKLNALVTAVDTNGVAIGDERLNGRTILWAAGVQSSAVAKWLDAQSDRSGRVIVSSDCTVPGRDGVFVIGDCANFSADGKPLPGIAPVAMQQGKFVAKWIRAKVAGKEPPAQFKYFDKGNMATIGRSKAVAQTGKLKLAGLIAWLAWLFIHITYLIGFRNKVLVLIQWAWAYISWDRGARLITGD